MRGGDTLRRDTLRFALAAMRTEEVARLGRTIDRLTAEGKDESARAAVIAKEKPDVLDDAGVLEVLQKQAKMRRDSIDAFTKGGRAELADKEKAELAVIEAYLPTQLAEDEIRAIAKRAIDETGAAGPRDMGKVMPKIVAATKDRADGRLVSRIVGELLKERA
ncbi:MAG TPA: GatB/YqeY domain-containing protein [Candidatus Limnocylindria bacterium]|nr:GatB/YqeY domain-containing protein [Candidatus Limnocylindria bacterium]